MNSTAADKPPTLPVRGKSDEWHGVGVLRIPPSTILIKMLSRSRLRLQGTQLFGGRRCLERAQCKCASVEWSEWWSEQQAGAPSPRRAKQPHLPPIAAAGGVIASFPTTPMWLLHANRPSVNGGNGARAREERAVQGRGHVIAWSPLEDTETRPRRTDTAPFAGYLPSSSQRSRRLRCAWIEAGGRGFWAMRRPGQGWGLRLAASHSQNSSPIARLAPPSTSHGSPHSI